MFPTKKNLVFLVKNPKLANIKKLNIKFDITFSHLAPGAVTVNKVPRDPKLLNVFIELKKIKKKYHSK